MKIVHKYYPWQSFDYLCNKTIVVSTYTKATRYWYNVTCKKCLKKKPRRGGMMIKSAEEAKRIIYAFNNTSDPMEIETLNAYESKGYLVALGGPEVKALLETIIKVSAFAKRNARKDREISTLYYSDLVVLFQMAEEALFQFREAVKKGVRK